MLALAYRTSPAWGIRPIPPDKGKGGIDNSQHSTPKAAPPVPKEEPHPNVVDTDETPLHHGSSVMEATRRLSVRHFARTRASASIRSARDITHRPRAGGREWAHGRGLTFPHGAEGLEPTTCSQVGTTPPGSTNP